MSLDPDPQDAHYEGLFSQENVIVDNSSIISPVAIGCVTVYNYSRKIPVSCKGWAKPFQIYAVINPTPLNPRNKNTFSQEIICTVCYLEAIL